MGSDVGLRLSRTQIALLGGLLVALVLAIFLTDLATGGNAEPPAPLGVSIPLTPGTRVVVVPTLVPFVTPTPIATRELSNEATAQARDAQRLQDLALLQAALAEYRDRFGEYPNSGGGAQSLCVYTELDAGCNLKSVLDDEGVLQDPLGDALTNGYWYASDGDTYTIWMLREGETARSDLICSDAVPFLSDKGPLFCLTGGIP